MADEPEWGPEIKTLGEAVREFARRHSPWMIGGAICALVAVRVLIDEPLTWRDAVAVAAMLVIYPFGEWAIHVYLLHAKPIAIRGRRFELPTTRDHRYHHRHPNNLFTLLLDPKELAELLLLAVPVVVVVLGVPVGLIAGSGAVGRAGQRRDRRLRAGRRLRVDPLPDPHRLRAALARLPRGSGATTACTTSRTSTTGTGSRTRSPTACSAPTPTSARCRAPQTARTLDPGAGLLAG